MNSIKFKITSTFVLLTATLLVMNGCKKDEHTHDSDAIPTITFLSPEQGKRVNESDTLWLRVNITSEDDIHDYQIEVTKVAGGTSVYKYDGHSHNTSVTTNLYVLPNVTADTEMKLSAKVLDHNGNATEKSITFTVVNTQLATKPVVNITSPNTGMMYNGQTLAIKGNIVHDKNLKSSRILLTQNDVPVLDYTKSNINANSYAFDTTHVINATTHSDYVLTISAIDVNDVSSSKTFSFHVHP